MVAWQPLKCSVTVAWAHGPLAGKHKDYAFGGGEKFEVVFADDLESYHGHGVEKICLGDVVERGPDWKKEAYDKHNSGGKGHVIGFLHLASKVVVAWWDSSSSYPYSHVKGDQEVQKVATMPNRMIRVGDQVTP